MILPELAHVLLELLLLQVFILIFVKVPLYYQHCFLKLWVALVLQLSDFVVGLLINVLKVRSCGDDYWLGLRLSFYRLLRVLLELLV